MSTHISQTVPAKLSTKEILAEIDGFKSLAVAVVERWAALLKELAERRVGHEMFSHPVMQFWKSIAEQELHPEAAVLLADKDKGKMIRAVMPLPRDMQLEVAKGEPVPIATLADTGEIKSDDIPIHRMDVKTLKRAFGPDGIRTVHEQAEMIRAEGRVEKHGMITVLRDESMLKIGNQKIKPEDLRGPLFALGYRLVLTREKQPEARVTEPTP